MSYLSYPEAGFVIAHSQLDRQHLLPENSHYLTRNQDFQTEISILDFERKE